jgi:hypothetical protein
MIVVLWILVVILLACVVLSVLGMMRLINKIQFYEQYIADMKDRFNIAYEIMKQADVRGSFEADDEVGDAFKIMKQAVDNLDGFVREEETETIPPIQTPTT